MGQIDILSHADLQILKTEVAQLSRELYYNKQWPAQILIDLGEDLDDLVEDYFTQDQMGAFIGHLQQLREVYNPVMKYDLKMLDKMIQICRKYYDNTETPL